MKEVKKSYFEELYYSKTDKETAEILGVTTHVVRKTAESLGLKLKGSGYVYPHDRRRKLRIIEGN